MKRLLSLCTALTLFSASVLPVAAADVQVTGNVTTATAPSTFVADESQVGGGASVRLPASIELTYDEAYSAFQYKNDLYCVGSIADGNSVAVKVPNKITYTGSDTATEIEAFVKLGGKNLYCFSNDDMANNIGKELLVQVPGTSVIQADTFEGTVNFEISLAPMGMYTSIETDTFYTDFSKEDYSIIPGIEVNGSSIGDAYMYYPVADSAANNKIHWNFDSLVQRTSDKFTVITAGVSDVQTSIKYATLSSSPYYKGAAAFFQKDGEDLLVPRQASSTTAYGSYKSYNLVNVFMNCPELTTVVVPGDITKGQLRMYLHDRGSGLNHYPEFTVSNYSEKILLDKNVVVGDAICFVKGIDSNNNWIYVPNIVYRGTKEQWKALSANGEDWVFGNAANIVTVHCTDGKLYY